MEQIILFSVIHSVLTKKGIKGKAHQAFIDILIGNGNLLHYLFSRLYSNREDIDSRFIEILELIIDSYLERTPNLKNRDKAKEKKDTWFLSNELAGMSLYVDRFAGNIKGLSKRIDYLEDLGVNLLHLMPLFESPEKASDGGYAVSNYRVIDKRFGNIDDLKKLQQLQCYQGFRSFLHSLLSSLLPPK